MTTRPAFWRCTRSTAHSRRCCSTSPATRRPTDPRTCSGPPTGQAPPVLRWARSVVGYLQGAAGDVSPRFTRQGRGAAEVSRLGGLLAAQVGDALARPGLGLPSVAPSIRRTTAVLKVRDLPSSAEAAATVASAEAGVRGRLDDPAARIAQTRLDGARGQALMAAAALPSELELRLSVVTLGDVAWVHLPVELFALHGLRLQAVERASRSPG